MKTKQNLKPKSLRAMESLWSHHIEPVFGQFPIRNITMSNVTKWVTDSVVGESAYTTSGRITKAQVQLCAILDFAVDHGLMHKNPIRKSDGKVNKITLPKTDRTRPAVALTPQELIVLARACGHFETLVLLAGVSGLRWAELVALQSKHFADDGKYVRVTRSLSEVNGHFYEVSTKSGQTRVVYLPAMIQSRIIELIGNKGPEELVFTNALGKPLSLSNFTNRVFKPAIKISGVPTITPHGLRHTAASIAISSSASVLSVANMLGHSDPSITLRIYAHLFDRDKESIALSIGKVFDTLSY
jgi:integrase